jgi:hypothetical protein
VEFEGLRMDTVNGTWLKLLKIYKASRFIIIIFLKQLGKLNNLPFSKIIARVSTDMRFLRTFSLNNFKIPRINFRRVRSEMGFVDREAMSEMAADYLLRGRVEAWLDSIEMAWCPPFDGQPILPPGWMPPEESFEDDEIVGRSILNGREHSEYD